MAEPKTERAAEQAAELLRVMSQSQSRLARAEPDAVTLMRLASDPLLVNAFLRRGPAEEGPCTSGGRDAVSGLVWRLQAGSVSFREWARPRDVRPYGPTEPGNGTSRHAFSFMPGLQDTVVAWEGEVSTSPQPPAGGRDFARPASCVALLALAGAILAAILLASFM